MDWARSGLTGAGRARTSSYYEPKWQALSFWILVLLLRLLSLLLLVLLLLWLDLGGGASLHVSGVLVVLLLVWCW